MIDYFEEKISNMSVTEIESFRRKDFLYRLLFGAILVLIGLYGLYQKNSYLLGFYLLLLVSFLIGYTIYYFTFLRGVTKILTNQLQPVTAKILFEKLYPKNNPVGVLNCATADFLMGHFLTAQSYISVLLSKTNLSKSFLQDCSYLQCFIFIVQNNVLETEARDFLNKYIDVFDVGDVTKKQTIKAILDIESGKPNHYFETAEIRHNLDKLIYQFYQAKNELLVGNKDRAKELFMIISELNDDIYFVREAQKYLKEF